MKRIVRLLSVLLAVLLVGMTAVPALAASDNDTLYPEEFYWDKAGEDADNGYKAYDVAYGQPLKIPPDPERYAQRFLGWKDWYTDEFVDLANETMNAKGRRFYAVWGDVTRTFRFYVDGELFTTTQSVVGESFVVPRSPAKDGYVFAGWSPKLPAVTPDADMDFDAQFAPETYIATLLVDGEVYMEIPYTYGQKSIDLPAVPKKDGYTGAWEGYSLVIGGVTIHAIYTPNTYIATLYVDGEVYMEIPYTYGQKSIDLPPVPPKAGYAGRWEDYSLGIGGVTIKAIYKPTDYTKRCMTGDAGGDGMVTVKDVTELTRYLAGGWDVDVHTPNSDVNGDGSVDLRDVTLLRRYLAGGWDVELYVG